MAQSHTDAPRQPEYEIDDDNIDPGDESDVEEYSEEDDVPFDIESDESNRPMTYEQMEAMYKPKAGTAEPKVAFEDENIETSPSDEGSNEYSEENEYDDDVSDVDDVDDSDLLKRLEEKYGKLPPTGAHIDDEIEDIEDEDDIDPTWTSKQNGVHSELIVYRMLCYRINRGE